MYGKPGFCFRFDIKITQQRLSSVASISDILKYCENRIHNSTIADFPGAANGLQLENNGQAFKIGASVDAGLIPFQKAVEAGIDFLIVHHLPLDCHPEIGNNALLAKSLKLEPVDQFHEYQGQKIGLIAQGSITTSEIRKRLGDLFPKGFTSIEKGSGTPQKIAIITGSGGSAIPELLEAGTDTLITGELRQHHFNQAEEARLNLYACGHYATETFGVSALAKEVAEQFDLDWQFIDSDCPL
jgi:putative NIF3 family GTP cyclohydrolase 1 type 2